MTETGRGWKELATAAKRGRESFSGGCKLVKVNEHRVTVSIIGRK
jgi:hypothetical protein